MAYHNHLAHDMTLPQFAEHNLGGSPAGIHLVHSSALPSPGSAGKPPGTASSQHLAGGPTWLNSAILRPQGHQFSDGSFLHLQTASDGQFRGGEDDVPVSSDSMIAAAMSDSAAAGGGGSVGRDGDTVAAGRGSAVDQQAVEGTWQNARYRAEILAHPLYEQLLSAHVACLRIATPVDQLPRIDAQLAQSQHVVAKYSVLGAGQMLAGDDKELDQFMTHYVLLLCSFKEQLQQHVRVHAMEAVMACWELEQSLQSLTGVSPGEGTGATMSDDDDDQEDSETNFYDGSLDGPDTMGFGPLVPTESERSLMERVRHELKHELKQDYKEKIVDIREEILRKRRAGKLPGDTTSTLKAWWQSHSKWPYPTKGKGKDHTGSRMRSRLLASSTCRSVHRMKKKNMSIHQRGFRNNNDDKARLVQETGLQLKQINNWFINQRKRNWHSNPSSSTTSKSKRKR